MAWMQKFVPIGKSLWDVNLPGTHDSVAYYYNGPYSQNQRLDITAQLNAGVRLFDIRIYIAPNIINPKPGSYFVFKTCHGFAVYQKLQKLFDEWKISSPLLRKR